MRLHTFSQFITESNSSENVQWFDYYLRNFQDFEFEGDMLELANSMAEKYQNLMNRYNWGRSDRWAPSSDHFTLNVKLYEWPSLEEASAVLGREIDDDELMERWYRFIEDQGEFWQEDMQEHYAWISKTGFGGNSGGWLLIYPELTFNDIESDLENLFQNYSNYKSEIENIEEIRKEYARPETKRLISLGLYDHMDEVQGLISEIDEIKSFCRGAIASIDQMEEGLAEIKQRFEDFRKNCKNYFLEELRESTY